TAVADAGPGMDEAALAEDGIGADRNLCEEARPRADPRARPHAAERADRGTGADRGRGIDGGGGMYAGARDGRAIEEFQQLREGEARALHDDAALQAGERRGAAFGDGGGRGL